MTTIRLLVIKLLEKLNFLHEHLREDIKIKKNCRKSENCIIYLTPPPSTERVKNKRMKYW